MDPHETADLISVPSTRRAILRRGARLAYAAPVVAATIRLSAQSAGAVSGPTCTPNNEPCDFNDPAACCSQCCVRVAVTETFICCDF